MLPLPVLSNMAHCAFGHGRSVTALPMVAPGNRSQVLQNPHASCTMVAAYEQARNS